MNEAFPGGDKVDSRHADEYLDLPIIEALCELVLVVGPTLDCTPLGQEYVDQILEYLSSKLSLCEGNSGTLSPSLTRAESLISNVFQRRKQHWRKGNSFRLAPVRHITHYYLVYPSTKRRPRPPKTILLHGANSPELPT